MSSFFEDVTSVRFGDVDLTPYIEGCLTSAEALWEWEAPARDAFAGRMDDLQRRVTDLQEQIARDHAAYPQRFVMGHNTSGVVIDETRKFTEADLAPFARAQEEAIREIAAMTRLPSYEPAGNLCTTDTNQERTMSTNLRPAKPGETIVITSLDYGGGGSYPEGRVNVGDTHVVRGLDEGGTGWDGAVTTTSKHGYRTHRACYRVIDPDRTPEVGDTVVRLKDHNCGVKAGAIGTVASAVPSSGRLGDGSYVDFPNRDNVYNFNRLLAVVIDEEPEPEAATFDGFRDGDVVARTASTTTYARAGGVFRSPAGIRWTDEEVRELIRNGYARLAMRDGEPFDGNLVLPEPVKDPLDDLTRHTITRGVGVHLDGPSLCEGGVAEWVREALVRSYQDADDHEGYIPDDPATNEAAVNELTVVVTDLT